MINTPFNYTGSKFLLLPQILPLFDYSKSLFIDLFAGSFVVGINVVNKYNKILGNDIIKDLIGIHREIINNPDDIIEKVKLLASCKEDEDKYYELRDSYNKEKTPEKLWALMLSCTNNFLRFNSKGNMNQSWGKREWNLSTQKKVDDYINYITPYRNKIYLSSVNFYDVKIVPNGMYYCDPPYFISEAGYNVSWTKNHENKLYDYLIKIDQNGASFALSGILNHNGKTSELLTKLINNGFTYKDLDFNYNKVSKIGNKNDTKEILIMNY